MSSLFDLYKWCPNCSAPLEAGRCSSCHFVFYNNPAPATTAVIFRQKQSGSFQQYEILLAKRAKDPQKDMWDLVGGFAEPGETIDEAMLREIEEETGVVGVIDSYLGSTPDVYGDYSAPTLNFLFAIQLPIDAQTKPQDDVSELAWFELDKIPQPLAFKNCTIALDSFREKVLTQFHD